MRKLLVYVLLSITLTFLTLLAYYFSFRITGRFVGFGQAQSNFEWWNISWHYRFKLEINSTKYERKDWPIEIKINFTDLLPSGTFDENSTRVIEYDENGNVLYELPSQFDKDDNFNPSSNAIGTLVFLMNGTTQANQKRIFFVYYDTLENGAKEKPNYPTNLSYSWNGEEFNVNTSDFSFWVDTLRGEDTSGLYRAKGPINDIWFIPSENERTIEYMQYSNGTHNFSFDFRNNATLKYSGAVRLVVEQKGYETFWDSGEKTNTGFVVKRYIFYNFPENPWIKIETNFTNIGNNEIVRNSTFAGAIGIDAVRAFGSDWQSNFGNTSQPGWWYASDVFNSFHTGIIQFNQTGTSNFWVPNSSSRNKIGIQLNETTIQPGSSVIETAVLHFKDNGGDYTLVRDLRNKLANPVIIITSLPEKWYVSIVPQTNATIYNRNETILITANISSDPYNLTKHVNATLDMGTSSQEDDQTIILYDDGTHGDEIAGNKVFTNTFVLANDATVGIWTINFTTYTENYELLNFTILNFNVTDVLNVTLTIRNKKPMVGSIVIADIYVKNFRQDGWIVGATINCSYDSTEVVNKIDYNNGTYSVNFTAPLQEGTYILTCNVTKNGNFGNDTDTFTTEPGKTNMSIKVEPENPIVSNITLYQSESFEIAANATNIGNGTAYSSNISLELLDGWQANSTLEECGDIDKNSYCSKAFEITVPNGTLPGNYTFNVSVTWKNPDGSIDSNKTQVNVTVKPNPKIDVEEVKVSGEGADGTWNIIGNFTVSSIGNDQLINITFSCISGEACTYFSVEFIPENISSLLIGSKKSVSINVSVPLSYAAGIYNGSVNVSAENDGWDTFEIEVIVPAKTNVSVTPSIQSYVAGNISQTTSESFEFQVNATNIGNSSARFVNLSLSLPTAWISNSSFEDCGNLTKGKTCIKGFSVTIPAKTSPGNYYVYVKANWTQPDNSLGTNQTFITVTVVSNPLINVSETNITGTIPDGSEDYLGNFTILSMGNDALQNITFNCISGEVCQNFIVEFIPPNVSIIPAGSNQSISINVSVPLGYGAGVYNGSVNISSSNDGWNWFEVEVIVPANRTWDMHPTYCQRSETPPEGLVCEVNVTNLGNTYINFTISPEEGNYTKVSETSFSVNAHSSHIFSVTYNVTGVPPGIYNSTFVVDAVEDASPDNKTLVVSLLPFVEPIVEVEIKPNKTEQLSSIEFFVNATDRSGTGMAWVKLNITLPNGTVQPYEMVKTYESGNLTSWYFKYKAGNTSQRGRYNVSIYARDNVGNIGIKDSSFVIYYKFNILVSTLSDRYYQGDQGSIYYSVRDLNDEGVANVSVEFMIEDPNGNITYYSSYKTNSDGTIYPLPSFILASDAPLGTYTLISTSSYFDDVANETFSILKNHSFEVLSRTVTVTGLFADIETAVVWYPDNLMKFGILTYNGEGKPVDADFINLTVYRPDGLLYFTDTIANMEKEMTGFYTYERSMSADSPSGMYLAVVNATQGEFQTLKLKAFRVARGGPYDLWIDLLENEVRQGDYLDFNIRIENKGEVSQDVFLEWWVSGINETYYYESGWFYTPALSNQTITKQAYIFTTQPQGTYTLTVKMTYDNVQPPLIANKTFTVLAKEVIPPNITIPTLPPVTPTITYTYPTYVPTAAAVAPAPTAELAAEIRIISYRENISVVRGASKVESVIVKNIGEVELENVTFLIFGIPITWYNITPETIRYLPPGNSTVFLITFNIPANANLGEHRITLTVFSGVVSDQKYAVITVFKSLEELLRDEISKLKSELALLEQDVKKAEKEGKDVSLVMPLIEDIRIQIELAEDNLKNNKLEDALENVRIARNLIDRARDLLSKLQVKKAAVKPVFPIWLMALILAFSILIPIAILLTRKKMPALRPYIVPLGRVAEKVKEKKEAKEELVRERERLLRMLEVLEKEKEEGIISLAAYKEMKKNIEEKLKRVEKKLK